MFDAPSLKVKRANQHIDELNNALVAFVQTDFYSLRVDEDTDTGNHVLKFEMTKPVPNEIPLIIGDAVHNLRAGLDLLACEIVSLSGGTPSKWTSFPIRETRQDVETSLNREIKIAGSDIVNIILNVIKPYRGGNDAIYALHSLDIIDKHRLLIPMITVAALNHVNIKAGSTTFTDCTFGVGAGGVLNILGMPSKFEIEGTAQPSFNVLFDKDQVFKGKPVIPTLKQLSESVSGIITAIEQVFLSRRVQ